MGGQFYGSVKRGAVQCLAHGLDGKLAQISLKVRYLSPKRTKMGGEQLAPEENSNEKREIELLGCDTSGVAALNGCLGLF